MLVGNGKYNCFQGNKAIKCENCKYKEKCDKKMVFEEKVRERKLEEEKKKIKCFKCVWAYKEEMYCPFPKCINEK